MTHDTIERKRDEARMEGRVLGGLAKWTTTCRHCHGDLDGDGNCLFCERYVAVMEGEPRSHYLRHGYEVVR